MEKSSRGTEITQECQQAKGQAAAQKSTAILTLIVLSLLQSSVTQCRRENDTHITLMWGWNFTKGIIKA